MAKINISELKATISKLNLAIEKSKINPKSGWIELQSSGTDKLVVKAGNYDYYLEATVPIDIEEGDSIHATVTAETFVPLVSKLDDETVDINERLNALIFTTAKSEYTFPIIKEMGKVKSIDTIKFNPTRCTRTKISGKALASVAETNAKGLVDAIFSKDIQQFVYVDNIGALTFTDNIYVNDFEDKIEDEFKFLLNCTQAKLLKVFEGFDEVEIAVEGEEGSGGYSSSVKLQLTANDAIQMTLITQSREMTDKFPSLRLRKLASAVSETHAIINKKEFEKALARLMVFDKKFDITVLNYSKLVFSEDEVKLVSIKNNNYEVVPYVSYVNTSEHESIIRFADIVNQLKAVQSAEIDISYGDSPAIVINSDGLKQLIPEIRAVERN